jgi:hypothetical protein
MTWVKFGAVGGVGVARQPRFGMRETHITPAQPQTHLGVVPALLQLGDGLHHNVAHARVRENGHICSLADHLGALQGLAVVPLRVFGCAGGWWVDGLD